MRVKVGPAFVIFVAVLLPPRVAFAGFGGTTTVDETGREVVSVRDWIEGTAQGSGPACVWRPGGLTGGYQAGQTRIETGHYFRLWTKTCPNGTVTEIWVPDISPAELAQAHAQEIIDQIPKLTPQFAPPLKPQYVGFATHIWFTANDLKPKTTTASVPQLSITLTATPTNVIFNSASTNGDLDCTTIPTKIGDCDFTYRETSKNAPDLQFEAGVTIQWNITYATTDGQSGTLQPIHIKTPIRIAVAQIQTINGTAP